MKRSELLKQLHKYFDQDLNTDMEPEWIEEILNICEKAGMLPPTVELSATGDFMTTKELLDEANIDYECRWEPEE